MEIAKAAIPDGYTLISATTAASTIAVILQKHPTYDPVKDYEHVVQFAVTPNVLVANPALPVKSVRELIDYCKAKQGQVNMASAGPGSQSHLSGAYFMQAGKFEAVHVPYKGGGPSVASVIAGESQWALTPAPAVMSFVRSGRLRALGESHQGLRCYRGVMQRRRHLLDRTDRNGFRKTSCRAMPHRRSTITRPLANQVNVRVDLLSSRRTGPFSM